MSTERSVRGSETDFVSSSRQDDFYVRRFNRATFLRRSFACFCAIITYIAVDAFRREAAVVFLILYRPWIRRRFVEAVGNSKLSSRPTTRPCPIAGQTRGEIYTGGDRTDPSIDRVRLACDATDSTRPVKQTLYY